MTNQEEETMELEAMYEGLGITPAVQKFCTEIEAQLKERLSLIHI